MKKIYKILGVCLLIIASIQNTEAQFGGTKGGATVTINGPANSSVGATETYTITPSAGLNITAGNWGVFGIGSTGTIISQNTTSATIQWNGAGTHSVKYVVTASNQGAVQGSLNVNVTISLGPIPPSTPNITNITCNSATLITTGNIPSGEQWYWQGTNSLGTSTANPATSSYTATTNGMYYIRARDNVSGQWSAATGVQITLSIPTWYADTDGDGLGDPNTTQVSCTQPTDYVSNNNDLCPNEHGEGSANGCIVPVSLSSNENYVYSITPQIEVTDINQLQANKDAIKNVTYFDGLGRAKQSIAIKQSATQKDIVTHFDYDDFGRQTKDFLPYASTGSTGAMKSGAEGATKSYYKTHYAEDFENTLEANINPYSEKVYENSPLNRVIEQTAPGDDWKKGTGTVTGRGYSDGHSIKLEYDSNDSNEVRIYGVNTSTTNPTLTGGASYFAAGKLTKTITKDENWSVQDGLNRTTEEFKNLKGQVVLKRTYNNSEKHDTYYVYDDLGNLTFVLPPKSEGGTATLSTILSTLNDLGYQYKYDYRNRLVEKKIPGKGWESIIYDKLDRPVMTQDAKQASNKQWLFTKYDQLGRVAYTGIYTHPSVLSRASMQNHFETAPTQTGGVRKLYESRNASEFGSSYVQHHYSNYMFPYSNTEILTVNYYDDYNFNRAGSALPTSITHAFGETLTTRVKGMATGSKVKVLETSNWITTVSYYDKRGRSIYTYSKNEFLGTTDIVQTDLDFAGKVLESTSTHTNVNDALATQSVRDEFDYDHAARLIEQRQFLNNSIIGEVIRHNTYDELGELIIKGVGGTTTAQNRLQIVDYTYNVRGGLTQINNSANLGSDLFGFKINYNIEDHGATKLFNGNISETEWKTKNDNVLRWYKYEYDALNRIKNAIDNQNQYSLTNVDYDQNGNITNLQRRGHRNASATSFGVMDDLNYTYHSNSNRLRKVQETSGGHATYGFKDGANTDDDYTYDANGNMLSDLNKGISAITYNHLNLPTSVEFSNQNAGITYVYDAAGMKLKKIVSGSGISTTTTEYAGNYIYGNGNLQFFNHAEGYVKASVNGSSVNYDYVYQYKDHLGNVRLSYADSNQDGTITASNEIVEESNYYPFGLKHKGYNNATSPNGNSVANDFLYNGKELQNELGLNWYDYGARMYNPTIARWNGLDKYSEAFKNYSGYSFALNSPVQATDIDGKLVIYVNGFRKKAYEGYAKRSFNPWNRGTRAPWKHKKRFFEDDTYNYWGEMDNMLGNSNYFNDNNNLYVDGMFNPHSTGGERYSRGYAEGKILAQMILSGKILLEEGETIKLVGHSHGGAHATGMTDALIEAGLPVKFLVLLAPHQPGQFGLKNTLLRSFQFSRLGDHVSSNQNSLAWYADPFVGKSEYKKTKGITFTIVMDDGNDDGLGNHGVHTYTDIEDLRKDHEELYNQLKKILDYIEEQSKKRKKKSK